jgi:hypothetical protein
VRQHKLQRLTNARARSWHCRPLLAGHGQLGSDKVSKERLRCRTCRQKRCHRATGWAGCKKAACGIQARSPFLWIKCKLKRRHASTPRIAAVWGALSTSSWQVAVRPR